ncbi:MAG TPA: ATP synthase F1 subunit gamma [Defluviitoga sp.]|nr:ATP synthase F1 subunit gamma [Defluviitoga sp.]HOP25169.1 ATP synthase F1 subunit gamma [Defluviitoga sp.]HPZ28369.1 ATP synthase F1 subunit gamma [Defluviitoga sp.]HQD62259.1 ATP synthase F1 subunit gamma [Defluviitoga sp.]
MSRGNLRNIKKRINSTESTMQITKAMQMVATARLNKIQRQWDGVKDFSFYAERILKKSPFVENSFYTQETEGTLVLVITPDMGLAGSFPSDLAREALRLKQSIEDFKGFLVIGAKGYYALRHEGILLSRTNLYDVPKVDHAEFLIEDLFEIMRAKNITKVKVLYGLLKNVLVQLPATFDLLPIKKELLEIDERYEYEPSQEEVFESAAYLYVLSKLYRFLFETKLSELHARQNAMKNATDNAYELIEELTLEYNKQRQTLITQELIEIISGAKMQ